MASILTGLSGTDVAMSAARRREILRSLPGIASRLANAQLDVFTTKLSDALFALSEQSGDAKEASLSFNASNLLKRNAYAFYHLASAQLEAALQHEIEVLENTAQKDPLLSSAELSLVPYEEMENKVQIDTTSRPFELDMADQMGALNVRIAYLIERDNVATAQNPFRAAVFVAALNTAWRAFYTEEEARNLVLPLLGPDLFLELPPIVKALNTALITQSVLPELSDAYRIKKSGGALAAEKDEAAADSALLNQLKRLFASPQHQQELGAMPGAMPVPMQAPGAGFPTLAMPVSGNPHLFNYLADLQKSHPAYSPADAANDMHGAMTLPQIKQQIPAGALTRMDEHTIDLLTNVFGSVFKDQHIPSEIKDLIGFLQVPVLKAALIDKNFFFEEAHPARRLIDLLTKSSVAWDQKRGQEDPLYQAMKRNVDRVQQEFDQEVTLFSEVVSDLESFLEREDVAANDALEAPISQALQQEKYRQAGKSAQSEVAMRVGTGEVVAFVETFLERKWVPVLTLAYRVRDEKPQVLENAIKTMDDLIWSVKPKITVAQRQELITKLPSILAMLNKWLTVIKWEDADRLQFFADLAECHASIVRAPLELSPHRQLEIAVEVAQKAAERRLEKRANAEPEIEPDAFVRLVGTLERGAWLEFSQPDDSRRKFKLAWVSPLRSLYIFTSSRKEEGFSLQVEELEESLRSGRAQLVVLERLVERALTEALESTAANAEAEPQALSFA